jgi:hypothetical protein
VRGQRTIAFECTIAVPDIDRAIRAIEASGGTIAAPKFHIPAVGTVAYFQDPEGKPSKASRSSSHRAFRCFPVRWVRTSRRAGSTGARCGLGSGFAWATPRSS